MERAVIYVDAGSNLSSLNSSTSPPPTSSTPSPNSYTCSLHHPSRNQSPTDNNNYVLKIHVGKDGLYSPSNSKHPLQIDIPRHRQRQLTDLIGDGDSLTISSGQSSPRSDMTPPPPQPIGNKSVRNGSCRFGSETSESDTESDISYEYSASGIFQLQSNGRSLSGFGDLGSKRHLLNGFGAVQFTRKEIHGIGFNSPDTGNGYNSLNEYKNEFKIDLPGLKNMDGKIIPEVNLKTNINNSLLKAFAENQCHNTCKFHLVSDNELNISPENNENRQKSPLPNIHSPTKSSLIQIDEESFHLQELIIDSNDKNQWEDLETMEQRDSLGNFAGLKDIYTRSSLGGSKEIRSEKGTIRGVKNRVRNGIATFLQIPDSKNFNEKEQGRVVVYVTSMGVVRDTYQRCQKVKKILRNLLVKFDERDCYMNQAIQQEIRERLPIEQKRNEIMSKYINTTFNSQQPQFDLLSLSTKNEILQVNMIRLPQIFIEGQYLGGVDTIEKLNENGELRKILQPYKSMSVLSTCDNCGGFRMLPCPICNGSKKSVHRNHFTEEFVALKCMHCDQSGLVKCRQCNP